MKSPEQERAPAPPLALPSSALGEPWAARQGPKPRLRGEREVTQLTATLLLGKYIHEETRCFLFVSRSIFRCSFINVQKGEFARTKPCTGNSDINPMLLSLFCGNAILMTMKMGTLVKAPTLC